MEIWILFVLVLINLKAFTQGQVYSWVRIDCGGNSSTATNGVMWQTDDAFIKTGTNHPIPTGHFRPLEILNSLRAFTEHNKNCYTLPAKNMTRYFIRAVFFYANYDGLNKPPTFDLQIDGNTWMTVVSSSTEVQYYEILYSSIGENISVCVARTIAGQFPFITSLESWPISDSMYVGMSEDLAWLATYRYNYGTNNSIIGFPGDPDYNRIWQPILSLPGTVNTTADSGIITSCDDHPPDSAVIDAIEAENTNSSLFLFFDPVKPITSIFIEAYFTEMSLMATGTRSFEVYANDNPVMSVTLHYWTCTAARILVQSLSNNLTIELRPSANTELPPIISAIEVYTASPLVTTRTNQNDLNGLAAFTSTFEQLEGWSGEPCLPEDTVWQWLGCKGNDPPRVTLLNLSGYNLSGDLPNFRQMQALEDIDLSNNSLSGSIPEFLGRLPNLRTLNLSHNDFSGPLPSSIRNNKRLTYHIDGNPNVDNNQRSSKAMIIGLALGIPLMVIILILVLLYWFTRKRAQNQEPDKPSESITISASTEQLIRPPHLTAPMKPTIEEDDEDCVPVVVFGTNPDNQSMLPEMDLDELEGLIDQYVETRAENEIEIVSDEDCFPVGVPHINANASNDNQSMVPDMDLKELDELIQLQNQRKTFSYSAGS